MLAHTNAMLARESARAAWQRRRSISWVVQIGVWLLLVVAFAGPTVLLLSLPIAAGLWLWETSLGNRFALWAWFRHLFEMIVAMYAGMLMYMAVVRPALLAIGGNVLTGAAGYSGMVLSMVLPMVALMRVQGHSWRMAGEMTLAMVMPIVLCFALVGLRICPRVPFLAWLTPASVYAAAHDGMLLGMVGLMVLRREVYAQAGPATQRGGSPASACS
jgi:hypothetical protein